MNSRDTACRYYWAEILNDLGIRMVTSDMLTLPMCWEPKGVNLWQSAAMRKRGSETILG